MTTIIFVAIGVILAGLAALFVIFYGGAAFGESQTKAEAARLVTEGQQLSYATDMFYRQEDRMPGLMPDGTLDGEKAMEELRDKDYIPIKPAGAKLTNVAEWKMEYGTDGMIYSPLGADSDEAALDVCREARRQLQFVDPVLDMDGNKTRVFKCNGSDYNRAHPAGTLPDREPCCIRDAG